MKEDAQDPLSVAAAEMVPGERLIWAERPLPRSARKRALAPALFGLAFLGFALFWTANAWQAGGGIALVGLPFVAIGGALATALWWRPKRARRTVYAISDQRLLIIRGWPSRVVRSFTAADVERLERHEHADGSGDLIFRREAVPHHRGRMHGGRWRSRFRTRPIGFFGIPEVRGVEAAVRGLQRGEVGAGGGRSH